MWFKILPSLLILYEISCQSNPCPETFTVESGNVEIDRWYGVISLNSSEDLNGVWLRISLDSPAELLGNWFGEVTSSDNREFTIKNTRHRLAAYTPTPIRFFVKYTTTLSVPNLSSIWLNGKTICRTISTPVSATTTKAPYISHTTKAPYISQVTSTINPIASTSLDYQNPGYETNDDEGFGGDFSSSRRPLVQPPKPSTESMINLPAKSTKSCGTVVIRPQPLITHGQETRDGEFPWHAAIYRVNAGNLLYICGASLITENHVLTAAHCVTRTRTSRPVNVDNLLIYLGKTNLKKFGNEVQDIPVKKIIVHPRYNATMLNNDLAVLELDHEAQITDYVRTVCLWEEDSTISNILNRLGTVVGWGLDETGKLTENLMQAKMPIVTTETCIYSNSKFYSQFTSPTTFCGSFRNGTSVCTGDSGGGMVFPKNGTRGMNTIWQLRGIVSLSAALQNERVVCDTSNYIVFSDVAKHIDWIRSCINTKK